MDFLIPEMRQFYYSNVAEDAPGYAWEVFTGWGVVGRGGGKSSCFQPNYWTRTVGWFYLIKSLPNARHRFQRNPWIFFPCSFIQQWGSLQNPYPMCVFFFTSGQKKQPPPSPAWFLIFSLGSSPRRKDTFSINCRQELQPPSRWLC